MYDLPQSPASSAPLAHDLEHVNQAVARLIQQYRDKPRMEALIAIYSRQVQDLEDALWQLATERFADTAIGAQLDVLGIIVGQERQGLGDDDYRALIAARIAANNSEGTAPDIYKVALAALGGAGNVRIEFKPPASFIVYFEDPIPFADEIINDLIQDARAAGCRAVVIAAQQATNQARFSAAADYPTFAAANGLDSAASPGLGFGQLARAMDEQTG